jgi:hypothetical protein
MNLKIRYLCIIFFLGNLVSNSQEDTGNWIMYFGTNKISDRLSIHSEVQYRNHTISPTNIEQLLLRTGLNYHIKPNVSATIGYAYIGNHTYESERKSPEIEEHRIWQQFLTVNKIGRFKFEHRYRIEERFIEKDFKTRFRYRLMMFYPLNRKLLETGSVYLGIYNELFINGVKTFFDRNRLYGGIGYKYDKNTEFQIGLLRQEVQTSAKTFLQFGIILNTNFKNKNK